MQTDDRHATADAVAMHETMRACIDLYDSPSAMRESVRARNAAASNITGDTQGAALPANETNEMSEGAIEQEGPNSERRAHRVCVAHTYKHPL